MRRFLLERVEDSSGVSGTGGVAEGVQFTTRACPVARGSAGTAARRCAGSVTKRTRRTSCGAPQSSRAAAAVSADSG